jgi:hypothetical protein
MHPRASQRERETTIIRFGRVLVVRIGAKAVSGPSLQGVLPLDARDTGPLEPVSRDVGWRTARWKPISWLCREEKAEEAVL